MSLKRLRDGKRSAAAVVAALLMWAMLTAGASTAQAYDTPWATGLSDPQDLVISVATFSPGDSVESWFGHTGLIVEDRRYNVSRLYNYGMFNFDRDMLLRFAQGRLWFWVAPTSVPRTYQLYAGLDRDIRLVELNIPPERRMEVARYVSENVRPENREYLYHHYDDNCSTRIRDIIDLAVGGQFGEALGEKRGRWTLREHTRRHSGHLPPMDWVLMFLMNGDIDGPSTVWEEMFLPEELERQLLKFDWVDQEGNLQPLALRTHLVYESEDREPVPEEPARHWPYWLLVGLGIGALGVLVGKIGQSRRGRGSRIGYGLYHVGVGLLVGIPGLVLGIMAAMTDHTVTYWNQNLFWANPATFLVLVLAVGVMLGKERARRGLVKLWLLLAAVAAVGVVVTLVGLVVPGLSQDMSLTIPSIVPIIIGSTVGAWLYDGRLIRPAGSENREEE